MRAFTISSLSLAMAMAVAAMAPARAAAQEQLAEPMAGGAADLSVADGIRVSPYFLLGFGGEAEVGGLSGDLDNTVGLGLRFEVPVHDYVTVGGLFEWGAAKVDNIGDRNHLIDVDAFIKGRYVLDAGGMPLELYALLPVGFSAAFFDDNISEENGIGWNLGLLFGATLFVSEGIGVFFDIGFMHHGLTVDTGGGTDIDVDANQARMDFGASFAF